MIISQPFPLRKIALIASLCVLGACETMPTAAQSEAASLNGVVVDETTGAGIFFPQATSLETPDIRFPTMDGVGPQVRSLFIDQVNLAGATQNRNGPVIIIQSVGEGGETLVFTHFDARGPMTPYLARGILARLTSIIRFTPAIAEMGLSTEIDIYSMAAALGFKRIIVTDGRNFAHEARLREE